MTPDDLDPKFIMSRVDSSLLMAIALGQIDARQLAKDELVNRGVGLGGSWVGFKDAEKEWSK